MRNVHFRFPSLTQKRRVPAAAERNKKWGAGGLKIKLEIPFLSTPTPQHFYHPVPSSNFPFICCSFIFNMLTASLWCSRNKRFDWIFNKLKVRGRLDNVFNSSAPLFPARPFYSCALSCLAFEWKWGWRWPCFVKNLPSFLMIMMLFSC